MEDSGQALTHELMDLSAAVDLIAQAAAVRLGVHQTDLICLHLLVRHGPLSAGEVAATLGVTAAAISPMAGRLEAGGFAYREMDPNDRRRVLLHASPAGAQQAYELFAGLYADVGEAFSRYSDRDVAMLIELLRTYRQLVTEHTVAMRRE
ncbi:MarR family transcriptional regulator [Lentzea tibetensis]|uniref:MarR family transcriptional regulator n=1 Tax=Lentzea tibetensis TaxID=2591470 RepID=A0A563ETQ0_9PSEU|nr:MarR family transcriptional regulator [Lentzea tibetensis]TWP50908.1 MarR family transcriptional regulator [Lentzea tibetensis]